MTSDIISQYDPHMGWMRPDARTNMEDKMTERRTATEIVAPVTETVDVEVTPKPKALSDEALVNAVREAVNELAGLMSLAKTRKIEISFQLNSPQENPNVVVPMNFTVKKDITNG